MTKPMTVQQVINRLQKLVDEGYGSAPVLSRTLNPAYVKVENVRFEYIGPSQWDNQTYRRTDEEGLTVIV